MEQVALVEFNSERDAALAVERIRASPFARSWLMRLMRNPEHVNPDQELMNKWLS